jgi:hypothetical protein
MGLRTLIRKCGLQGVFKKFDPPEWAALRKKFTEPMELNTTPPLGARLKKSSADWLEDRIRFPRYRVPKDRSRIREDT